MSVVGKYCAAAVFGIAVLTAAFQAPAQNAGLGQAGELIDPTVLRVCADPSNMPFSDMSGEGFENKLAEFVASKTGRQSVSYVWFPSLIGFVRNTLGLNRCDVIMGYAQGDELVQNTNAYYRSSYVLMVPENSDLVSVKSLRDDVLKGKKIGVVESTPPTTIMAQEKLMMSAKIYPMMIDTRLSPTAAEIMVRDMEAGIIDAAVAWGPMAGFYAKQSKLKLKLIALTNEKGGQRMSYRITMGVRPSDQEWKRTLNRLIKDHQSEINSLLASYSVPLLDENNNLISVEPTQ